MTITATSAPSMTPTLDGTSQEEKTGYSVRESTIFGYSVAGMFGLLGMYLLWRWCTYKVRNVRLDKKRVREMVAQDLPGKPRYPIFSAIAGLFCTIGHDEMEESVAVQGSAVVAANPHPPTASVADTTSLTTTGQGAYINSPTNYTDLEENLPSSSQNSFEISELSEISSANGQSAYYGSGSLTEEVNEIEYEDSEYERYEENESDEDRADIVAAKVAKKEISQSREENEQEAVVLRKGDAEASPPDEHQEEDKEDEMEDFCLSQDELDRTSEEFDRFDGYMHECGDAMSNADELSGIFSFNSAHADDHEEFSSANGD